MARLFGKEFHGHSNSWFFKSSIIHLKNNELTSQNYLNENGNIVFKFEPNSTKYFDVKIEIIYDKNAHKILQHRCSKCGKEECKHYLSVLNYAYKFLSTEILDEKIIQTYHSNLLNYNEFWQRTVLNAKIEIADIYNQSSDKIRFYLKSYKPLEVRLISIILAGHKIDNEDLEILPKAERQMKALSSAELELFKLLQKNKCSFSRKNSFFTIYKTNFINLLPTLKNLHERIFVRETGDKLIFSDEELRINFRVHKIGDDKYSLTLANKENISVAYSGSTTYIFKKNTVFPLILPFKEKVIADIFSTGFLLKQSDLVYLSSVVARQLALAKCFLDFDEDIEIDEVHHNTPIITYQLKKNNDTVIMEGLLDYKDGLRIPMSTILLPVELVRFDQQNKVRWFYIPPQTKFEVRQFAKELPQATTTELKKKSQLIFEGKENIEILKKVIFEFGKSDWNIELCDELKKEFIYKVELEPIIKTKSTGKTNWFEYQVEYNYKDVKFTHSELKKIFKTKEKFHKLKDGRLLFFENRDAFDEVDILLKKSKKEHGESYKLSIYNLPFVYQLNSVNKGISIIGDEYLQNMFIEILKQKSTPEYGLPFNLQPIMRSYQKAGFQWLMMLKKYGMSGILADDMGLGKTIQAISVLSTLNTTSVSLVICPKTLLFNWANEIDKFGKNLSYQIYEGSKKERANILKNLNTNILFASYSIIQNDIKQLEKIDFEYIILDEAQHIKNATAMRTKAIKELTAKNKMALSGTPIENHPLELWSIFDFLMPGFLPPIKKFKNSFIESIDGKIDAQNKLKMFISPFILRRKKNEVLIELPDKQEQIVFCKMAKIQEKIYLQLLEKIKTDYLQQQRDKNYIHLLAALTKLRQICNHPALLEKTMNDDFMLSGKLETLREIVLEAIENDKKILIFSQFVQMLQIIKKLFQKEKIKFEYMDGSTKNRQERIENFNNNNNIRAFLISLKTGGYGLNLTAADTVIIVDPWWNPMTENQAIDRAHRIGQTKKVMIYKLITKNSIEEKIVALQKEKREMFENIIEDGQNVLKKIDVNELQKILEN